MTGEVERCARTPSAPPTEAVLGHRVRRVRAQRAVVAPIVELVVARVRRGGARHEQSECECDARMSGPLVEEVGGEEAGEHERVVARRGRRRDDRRVTERIAVIDEDLRRSPSTARAPADRRAGSRSGAGCRARRSRRATRAASRRSGASRSARSRTSRACRRRAAATSTRCPCRAGRARCARRRGRASRDRGPAPARRRAPACRASIVRMLACVSGSSMWTRSSTWTRVSFAPTDANSAFVGGVSTPVGNSRMRSIGSATGTERNCAVSASITTTSLVFGVDAST